MQPDFFVDISGVIEDKQAMLACHQSQRKWLDVSQGLDSYLATMRDMSAEVGRMSGRFALRRGVAAALPPGLLGPRSGTPSGSCCEA